jgi:hypothetical protein
MKEGNWLPMDKSLIRALPNRKPYTLIEAVFSYQYHLDIPEDRRDQKTVSDWARIWKWSRDRVERFLKGNGCGSGEASERHRQVKFRFIEKLERCNSKTSIEQPQGSNKASATIINPELLILNNFKNKYTEFVFLSDQEHQRLIERFGDKGTSQRIEQLNNYIGSKGRRYISHYHTILSWEHKKNTTTVNNNTCAIDGPIQPIPNKETENDFSRVRKEVFYSN